MLAVYLIVIVNMPRVSLDEFKAALSEPRKRNIFVGTLLQNKRMSMPRWDFSNGASRERKGRKEGRKEGKGWNTTR